MRRPGDSDQSASAALAPYAPPTYSVPTGPYGAPHHNVVLPPPPAARNVPTFIGLLNAFKRRWVLASFLGLLVAAAAAVALWIAAPQGKHQVKALLEITPNRMGVLPGAASSDDGHESFKQNQMVLIKTRTLLNRVAQSPELARVEFITGSEDPAKVIEDNIRLRWDAPDLMAVLMNGDKPEELKKVLDVLIVMFSSESASELNKDREKHKDKLVTARQRLMKDLDEQLYNSKLGSNVNAPQTPDILRAQVENCTQDIRRIKVEKQTAEVRLAAIDKKEADAKIELDFIAKKRYSDEEIEAVLIREKDTFLLAIQAEIDATQLKYDSNFQLYVNKEHPKLTGLLNDIKLLKEKRTALTAQRRPDVEKKLRADRRDEIEKGLQKEREERSGLASNVAKYASALEGLEADLVRLNKESMKVAAQYERLKPTVEQLQNLDRQIEELKLWADATGRIKVRETAVIMYNHNQRQKMLYSAMVGAAAFLAVVVLVAFLEWRTRRVDSVDQVVNEIGMRVVGTIPAFPTRQSIKTGEADANQNWRFILNESVNSTRTMLLHAAKTHNMQVIMVTSAMQGEGKTSLSSQLATSMATAGLRTLIVDCDLRNPSMHRLFDLPLAPGCSEILLSELDVSDAVQATTVPNLWVIPAGQCSNRVIAALAQGHQLESLFNRLRGQFDFIVVDSCPVLPVADSLLIGQHVDGVLISILQDISQLPKVLNASERLSQLNIPLLGAVVNGIKTDIHAYGYNYVKQLPA
jgi:capsular exopolysaccharide synthesis family protein